VNDAGIVDNDVERSERVEGDFDCVVPVVEFGYVALDRYGLVFAVGVGDFLAVGFAGGALVDMSIVWSQFLTIFSELT
jgi:hypothetical protein